MIFYAIILSIVEKQPRISPLPKHASKIEVLKTDILNANPGRTITALREINDILTVKRGGDFHPGAFELLEKKVTDFMHDPELPMLHGRAGASVTLGDGESRLILLRQNQKVSIFLSEVSTEEVQSRWQADFEDKHE